MILSTDITFADIMAGMLALGALSGLIIYFFSRPIGNKSATATINKTNKEIEQIEQEIESRYITQVKDWLEDLQEIKDNNEIKLAKKDAEIVGLHTQYLASIKEISEQKLKMDRFNRATRRVLVNMDIPYWECDSQGKLSYVNGAWLTLFGMSQTEVLGSGWLSAIPEKERAALKLDWSTRVVDQSETPIEFNLTNPLTNKTTRVKSLYAIIFDSEDNIFKIIGVTVELTS